MGTERVGTERVVVPGASKSRRGCTCGVCTREVSESNSHRRNGRSNDRAGNASFAAGLRHTAEFDQNIRMRGAHVAEHRAVAIDEDALRVISPYAGIGNQSAIWSWHSQPYEAGTVSHSELAQSAMRGWHSQPYGAGTDVDTARPAIHRAAQTPAYRLTRPPVHAACARQARRSPS